MDGDKPVEGQWDFDHDNRKAAPKDIRYDGPMQFDPDTAVMALVAERFGDNFGDLEPMWFATDTAQAQRHFEHWLQQALPYFGDYQDAMLNDNRFLYHSVISFYINAGLLDPLRVCQEVEAEYRTGRAPINAVEGFIRQIIGWREYMRGIYFLQGSDYTSRNVLGHTRELPPFFWGAETKMNCIAKTVEQTKTDAYAHHIQRLGIVGSKPYVSSGAYISRMSDYCKACAYKVKDKTGDDACPFNVLYWDFLIRHRDRFSGNARMGNMYRTWERMKSDHQSQVLQDAAAWLTRMEACEPI